MGDTFFTKNLILQPTTLNPKYGLQTDGSNLYFNNVQIDVGSVPSLQQVTEIGAITDKTVSLGKLEVQGTSNLVGAVEINSGLEVTGDIKVGGGIEIDSSGIKGVILNSKVGVNQVNISMNDNTQTWDISADASSNTLFFNHIVNGAGVGAEVASLSYAAGNFTSLLPGLYLNNVPTSAAGLTSGRVWSNAGVLNIIS